MELSRIPAELHHIYIRDGLTFYDWLSCNRRHHQYAFLLNILV